MTLFEIVDHLGGSLDGDGSVCISQVASLHSAKAGEISFLVNQKYKQQLQNTRASAVILPPQFSDDTALPKIIHPNPYAYYARVVALLNPFVPEFSGTHVSAQLSSDVPLSANIGAHVAIGARVMLGENVTIYPGCVIGNDVCIGNDSLIYPNVTIYDKSIIGERAVIHSGVVIGSDGFGFAKEGERWIKIAQIGKVVIGNDVEIGANTTIDRGALDDTIIADGVKLDNQIQVAHNVFIGENSAMAGCVGIAGSARIGRQCTAGGAAMISGHLEIADGTHISAGTLISKSIKKPGYYTGFYPMETHEQWLQNAVQIRRLKRLADKVADLEKKLEQMEKKN